MRSYADLEAGRLAMGAAKRGEIGFDKLDYYKGFLNKKDLNDIESKMGLMASILGVGGLTFKTDWAFEDLITAVDLERISNNFIALGGESVDLTTIEGWNTLESGITVDFEELGLSGIEMVFNTSANIEIGMAGRNGGVTVYGVAYNWDIYLNDEFVGNYQGVTAANKVITIPNSENGEHKVVMVSKLANTDYCARSINFTSEWVDGIMYFFNYIGSHDKIVSARGFGDAFKGESAMPSYCFYGMFWGTSLKFAPELTSNTIANECYSVIFKDTQIVTVKCHYTSNLDYAIAGGWLDDIRTTGTLYSPNAVITFGLPNNWTTGSL